MMKDIEACFIGRVGTDAVELRTSAGGKLWRASALLSATATKRNGKAVVFGERAQQLAGHLHKSDVSTWKAG